MQTLSNNGEQPLIKHPRHRLLSQLHPQESRRIGRHRPRHCGREPRKERLDPPPRPQLPARPRYRRIPRRTLQPALNRIHRKHGNPHGHPRRRPRRHDGRKAQLPRRLPRDTIHRRHPPLYRLVRREIRRRPGPVARQRHGATAKDAAHAALPVELADDVEAAGVFGLFAGFELLLALDLQQHFYALEGGGDEGLGNGGEEAGGGDLGDGEGVVFDGAEAGHEPFAEVVALRWFDVSGVGLEGGEWGKGLVRTQKLTATVLR